MKLLLPLASLFVLTFQAAAQKTCDLTLKDSPSIRGIKLGMPEDDLNAVLEWNYEEHKRELPKRFGIHLTDIQDVDFDFYKGKLARAKISYDRSMKWKNAVEFT